MYRKLSGHQEEFQQSADRVFSESDQAALKEHGIPLERAMQQLAQLREGVSKVQPVSAVTEESGFLSVFSEDQIASYVSRYDEVEKENPSVYFVPAAGAASRMFKLLRKVVDDNAPHLNASMQQLDKAEQQNVNKIFQALKNDSMAFCNDLKKMANLLNFDLTNKIESEDIVAIFKFILDDMDYNNLPKAVIPAHYYSEEDARTPMEEHVRFLKSLQGLNQRIHLAISSDHQSVIDLELERIVDAIKAEGVDLNIDFTTSYQQEKTDAIAFNVDKNEPLHDSDGNLVIRKAGHGSLMSNLDDLAKKYSGIFLRNIDNVKPDNFTEEIATYKKVMRVKASELEDKAFMYIEMLRDNQELFTGIGGQSLVNEVLDFVENDLLFHLDRSVLEGVSLENQKQLLIGILDRPIAVVAYVPLEPGQKGGGGFVSKMQIKVNGEPITVNKATTVEQQELDNGKDNHFFKNEATHFNPVDIYLTSKRYNGEPFVLSDFTDKNRAMVDDKDLVTGVKSRIWENPGLWNGSMAEMFQVSIHAPKETFAPIKEFHNTLDPDHTPGVN